MVPKQPAKSVPSRRRRSAEIIPFGQRLLPRHLIVLAQWLAAGARMGLCDAAAHAPDRPQGGRVSAQRFVLVWVRENSAPAYRVTPSRDRWLVEDMLQGSILARVSSFEDALQFIRPVLKFDVAA